MKTRMRFSPMLCLLWAFSFSALAQPIVPGSNARISLLTVAPGAELYSIFGHSAFRISDPQRGVDYVYNYGTFDFNTPGFYSKFIMGRLPYMLSISYTHHNIQAAMAEGRNVLEQELELTPHQKQQLITYLHTNYLPHNRYYPYDFFNDNCATRLRDALEKILGDSLRWQPNAPTHSFRQLLDGYLLQSPYADFGIDLLLGRPSDALADHRQVMYLPDSLLSAVAHAQVRTAMGWQPLVRHSQVLYQSPMQEAGTASGPLWPIGMLLTLAAWLAVQAWRVQWLGANLFFDRILFLLVGLLGCLLFVETFIADHAAMKQNLNLLWALPTHAIAAFLLQKKWIRYYALVAASSCVLVMLLGLAGVQALHTAAYGLALLLLLRWLLRWRLAQ